MSDLIRVTYPKELAFALKMQNDEEVAEEMRRLAIVKLYELGKISSSLACKILDMTRVDFLDLLADYHVSIFTQQSENDILNDMKNA